MEISKMLTISTAHITKETAEWLDEKDILIVYKKSDYGWFILVSDWDDVVETEEIPEDLRKILRFADDLDCRWLCLDCDGDILSYLDVYNW